MNVVETHPLLTQTLKTETVTTKPVTPVRHLGFCGAALAVISLVAATEVLACGGGGSGAYRKPPRPDQHQHAHSVEPDVAPPAANPAALQAPSPPVPVPNP